LRLKIGSDIPGKCVESAQTQWDSEYNLKFSNDTSRPNPNFPRSQLANELSVKTAFSVNVPGLGGNGTCGVLSFYSSQCFDAEPLMVSLIEKATQLMAASALDPNVLSRIGKKSMIQAPMNKFTQPSSMCFDKKFDHDGGTDHEDHSGEESRDKTKNVSNLLSNSGKSQNYFQQKIEEFRSLVISKLKPKSSIDSTFHRLKFLTNNFEDDEENRIVRTFSKRELDMEMTQRKNEYSVQNSESTSVTRRKLNPREAEILLNSNTTKSMKISPSETSLSNESLFDAALALAAFGQLKSKSTQNDESSTLRNLTDRFIGKPQEGTKFCIEEGCTKCAQGPTKLCFSHGGGHRCTHPGCDKGARGKFFCAAHGGGKRCCWEGCNKSAVGGSGLCTAHGGGRRCKWDGCNKSSQSSTDFCVNHGGGKSCKIKGCTKVFYFHSFAVI
jgi:hypothetical protein